MTRFQRKDLMMFLGVEDARLHSLMTDLRVLARDDLREMAVEARSALTRLYLTLAKEGVEADAKACPIEVAP
jgi:hypothetical protein